MASLWLKKFDVYPKLREELKERTASGATISVFAIGIMCLLFLSELRLYWGVKTVDHLIVDVTRDRQIPIHFNFTFPRMPCSLLSVDAMDLSGSTNLDLSHDVYKMPLDHNGKMIGGVLKHELGSESKMNEEKVLSEAKEKEDSETNSSNDKEQVIDRTAGPGDPNYCGSCYGAEESDSQCCNSCEEVEQAYLKKGWLFLGGNSVEQCVTEVDHRASSSLKRHEGCMVFGNVLVSKVSGNFHFAPGHGFQAQHTHVHDLSAFMAGMFNVSHSIDKLAFGDEYPGVVNPLDKTSKTIHVGGGIFQYYIKVVPTRYEFLNGTVIDTNQYSVTEHSTNVMNKEGLGLPGVFVFYEVSPIAVNFQEQSRSFGHFITQLCAIIGGVFTVAGIVDKIIYSSISKIQKARMGKFI